MSAYLGVDLDRPLQDSLNAHIRRAAAENSPQPCRAKEYDKRLNTVRTHDDNAVAASDTSGIKRSSID